MSSSICNRLSQLVYVPVIALALVCCTGIPPAHSQQSSAAGVLPGLLKAAGIDAEMKSLQRSDGFSDAVLLQGQDSVPVLIGFDENRADTFLISIDGWDNIVTILEDGSYVTMAEDGAQVPVGLCILDAVVDMLVSVSVCEDEPVCVFTSIFAMVLDIVECVQ